MVHQPPGGEGGWGEWCISGAHQPPGEEWCISGGGGGGAGEVASRALNAAGIPAEAMDAGDFTARQLKKFLVNSTANLMSVVYDAHCADLLRHHRGDLAALLEETVGVLGAHAAQQRDEALLGAIRGLPADGAVVEAVEAALASYGTHHPSTWHDYKQGAALEVASLNGFLVEAGKALGRPTPLNSLVVAACLAKGEAKRVEQDLDRMMSQRLEDVMPVVPWRKQHGAKGKGKGGGGGGDSGGDNTKGSDGTRRFNKRKLAVRNAKVKVTRRFAEVREMKE